jgi:hypothetical protein
VNREQQIPPSSESLINWHPELNPRYVGLGNRFNTLSEEVQALIVDLRNLNPWKMGLRESGIALQQLQDRALAFEQRMAHWIQEAENFSMAPAIVATPGFEQFQMTLASMQMIHFVNQLQGQFRIVTESILQRELDRRVIRSTQQANRAMWVAIASLVLAVLAFSGIEPHDLVRWMGGLQLAPGGHMSGSAWLQVLGLGIDIVGALMIVRGLFISDEDLKVMFTPYPGSQETALETKGAKDRKRQVRLGRIGGWILVVGFLLQVAAVIWREVAW